MTVSAAAVVLAAALLLAGYGASGQADRPSDPSSGPSSGTESPSNVSTTRMTDPATARPGVPLMRTTRRPDGIVESGAGLSVPAATTRSVPDGATSSIPDAAESPAPGAARGPLIGHTYRLTRLYTDDGGGDTRDDGAFFTITFTATDATAASHCGTIAYPSVRYYRQSGIDMVDLGRPVGPACSLGTDPSGVPAGELMTGCADGECYLSTGYVAWYFEQISPGS